MNQYTKALKANNSNLIPYVDENNLTIWYFLIKGLKDTPFEDGEYIFKLKAPDQFPHKPPSFEFCTPNGVYDIGGKICISVGEFHANDKPGSTGSYGWRPSLGMYGFANEVLNGLINYKFLDHGIRILSTATETKKKLASESIEYNKKYYSEIYTYFISMNASSKSEATSVKNETEDEGELILLFLIENFN
jgi:ubiquitin-conjugating enzyme E2 J2